MIPTHSPTGDAQSAARTILSGIYGIVDSGCVAQPVAFGVALLHGGIRVLQYRAKAGIDRGIVRELCRLAHAAGACVIVNDDFEAALLADGWHAGQGDLAQRDSRELRERLEGRLFGISCWTPAQARAAEASGADYVGTGPFARTSTKTDARAPIGAAGVSAVVRATGLPVVAIGGINGGNLAAAAATGAAMAAVISSVAFAADPAVAARELVQAWADATR